MVHTLTLDERIYFRDRLRAARYAALADAEGFGSICFAVEALGVHLSNREEALNKYLALIRPIAERSIILSELPRHFPGLFSTFGEIVKSGVCGSVGMIRRPALEEPVCFQSPGFRPRRECPSEVPR
ncbi:hypothetical protein LGM62_39790, partial [Burkholderia contaminans]|nr:hypothetical protein [Burkholderia contaminans]